MSGLDVDRLPSYAQGAWDVPLLGDTIGDNLDRTAARFGDREALVDSAAGKRWSYSEFVADVDAFALGMLRAGITKGDRVGIWAPNCWQWVLVQYATAKIGAILVNINLPTARTSCSTSSNRPVCGCWCPPRRSRPPTTRR